MSWPEILVFVRHGEALNNTLHIDELRTHKLPAHEFPLTERGRHQALITRDYLRTFERHYGTFDAHFVSPFARPRETAHIFYPDTEWIIDSRLSEFQHGIWQTMTLEKMAQAHPHEIERRKKNGAYHNRPIGGENWLDGEDRVHNLRNTLFNQWDGKRVLLVGHGHWFLLWRRIHMNVTPEEGLGWYETEKLFVDNASVTIYRRGTENGVQKLKLLAENIVPWKRLL